MISLSLPVSLNFLDCPTSGLSEDNEVYEQDNLYIPRTPNK